MLSIINMEMAMRWLITALLAAAMLGCASKTPVAKQPPVVHPLRAARPIDRLKDAPLYTFNEAEVDAYLKYLHEAEKDPIARVVHLARKNIGQPYAIYLLGEFPYETYDPDPMYCLEKSDCVTFVEHTYAMALSKDWASFFKLLQRIRYKDGKVGMLTRNHETVADWEPNNSWLFEDITGTLGGGKETTKLHLLWQPSKFFGQFGIGQDMKDVVVDSVYVPAANVPHIVKELHPGDLIHIVRGTAKEQYVGHFGMITFAADGKVNMLHSHEPRVGEGPLLDYFKHNPKTLGIKVLRPRTQLEQIVAMNVKAN
jgi:hypothetical protein